MPTALVISDLPAVVSAVSTALQASGIETLSTVANLPAGVSVVASRRPDVLFLGPDVPALEGLEFAGSVLAQVPHCGIVLQSAAVGAELLRAAMRVGLVDVLPADATADEVLSAAARAREHAKRLRIAAMPERSSEPVTRAKVVSVFSTKGGVGKTVIATNVAVALASVLGKRTVLVDLDLQFGDVGIVLDVAPERTIFDAAQVFDRLDEDMLKGFIMPHPSGLSVLLAPVRPEDAETLTASRIGRVLDLVASVADYVVIDTAAALDDIVLTAVDKSDEVYAVATMDVASVKNTRVSLQKLEQIGYDGRMVRLVLNRADSKVLLEPAEVQRSVGGTIVAQIPSDRLVPRCVNRGVPVVTDAPRAPVSRKLIDLARFVATREEVDVHDASGPSRSG